MRMEAQIWLLACSGGYMGHALLLHPACAGISWLHSHQSGDSTGVDRHGHCKCRLVSLLLRMPADQLCSWLQL